MLVLGADIFGFANENMRANADMLSEATGAAVVVPDFFRGHTAAELPEFTPEVSTTRATSERHPFLENSEVLDILIRPYSR